MYPLGVLKGTVVRVRRCEKVCRDHSQPGMVYLRKRSGSTRHNPVTSTEAGQGKGRGGHRKVVATPVVSVAKESNNVNPNPLSSMVDAEGGRGSKRKYQSNSGGPSVQPVDTPNHFMCCGFSSTDDEMPRPARVESEGAKGKTRTIDSVDGNASDFSTDEDISSPHRREPEGDGGFGGLLSGWRAMAGVKTGVREGELERLTKADAAETEGSANLERLAKASGENDREKVALPNMIYWFSFYQMCSC